MERLPGLAADLVRLGVDIIIVSGANSMAVAMKATTTIPLVMTTGIDPVSAGLVRRAERHAAQLAHLASGPRQGRAAGPGSTR